MCRYTNVAYFIIHVIFLKYYLMSENLSRASKKSAYMAAYRKKNSARIKQSKLSYNVAHPDKVAAWKVTSYKKHRVRLIAKQKLYASLHRESISTYKKQYRILNSTLLSAKLKSHQESLKGKAQCLWHDAYFSSLKKAQPFFLSKADVLSLLQLHSVCSVTQIPFDYSRDIQRNPWAPSLDRYDSSKPYSL